MSIKGLGFPVQGAGGRGQRGQLHCEGRHQETGNPDRPVGTAGLGEGRATHTQQVLTCRATLCPHTAGTYLASVCCVTSGPSLPSLGSAWPWVAPSAPDQPGDPPPA